MRIPATIPLHIYIPHKMIRSVWPACRQADTAIHTQTHTPTAQCCAGAFYSLHCERQHLVIEHSGHLNTAPAQWGSGKTDSQHLIAVCRSFGRLNGFHPTDG